MQEGQHHPKSGNTSRTNMSFLNVMPQKRVLEYVLDVLQRNDQEEFFAAPVPPNVEYYYRAIKNPMDFGTMRAKVQENMYRSMEEFKFDVYLLCANAMNANPANTRRHQVAKAIQSLSRRVFGNLSATGLQQYFQLESFPINRPPTAPSRKPQGGQPRTIGHARFRRKPAGSKDHDASSSHAQVLPTLVISGSQPKPPESTLHRHWSSDDQPPSASGFNVSKPMPEHLMLRNSNPRALIHSHMNNPSRICIWPSQAANFSRQANPNTSHQGGYFQALLSPPVNHVNNNHEQAMNQVTQWRTTLTTFDYTHLEVQLGLKNPMGPFPMLRPNSSGNNAIIRNMNVLPSYDGGDEELNLALQL